MPDTGAPALTLAEVAQILNCSERTVRREIDAGRLRSVKLGGRRRVFPSDLRSYIEAHKDNGDTVVSENPALLRSERILRTSCLLHCRDGSRGYGVIMFFLATYSLSHACPHVRELVGMREDELLEEGWRRATDGQVFDSLTPAREAGRRHLVLNYPIRRTHGHFAPFDALIDPVLDINGKISNVLVAVASTDSGWREIIAPELQVNWAEPPESRFRNFPKNFSPVTVGDTD